MYTIHFQAHQQDNLNFVPAKAGHDTGNSDYATVVAHSIKQGNIESEADIRSYCDGSDHVTPYFTSQTATQEACDIVNGFDGHDGHAVMTFKRGTYDYYAY